MAATDAFGPNEALEAHERLEGSLRGDALERLAGFLLGGDAAGAANEAARHGCDPADARALAGFLAGPDGARRGGPGTPEAVLEDLRCQPVAADVAGRLLEGRPRAAALLMALHEGYAPRLAEAAARLLRAEVEGRDVRLVEVPPPAPGAPCPTAAPGRHSHVVRHGTEILAGAFETWGEGAGARLLFRHAGGLVEARALRQAWRIESTEGGDDAVR